MNSLIVLLKSRFVSPSGVGKRPIKERGGDGCWEQLFNRGLYLLRKVQTPRGPGYLAEWLRLQVF